MRVDGFAFNADYWNMDMDVSGTARERRHLKKLASRARRRYGRLRIREDVRDLEVEKNDRHA